MTSALNFAPDTSRQLLIRLILDAHISGPGVGEAFEREGHDVFAVDQRPDLEGLSDTDLLALATNEERVLATANVRHFVPLVAEVSGRGEPHPGLLLIPKSIRSEDFGSIISEVRAALEGTSQEDWIDRAHRRHLSAVRTLAQIRKLGPAASLQINIAKKQINTAG